MPDIKDLNVARNKWPLFIIGLPGRNSIRFVKLMVMILEFSGRAIKFVGETNMYGGVHV